VRIIAIDYGKKRCGLSVTDPLQIIATHLAAIETKELLPYLKEYCLREEVEGFVIGKPLTLKNELNEIYKDILLFKDVLALQFPDKYIDEIDERYTSKMATQSILDSGVNKKKRQDKSLVDMVSAVIILQNYLDLQSTKKLQ
jgi:putative holliday junction resolvase